MQRGETQTALHLREGRRSTPRLVIGADGANSQARPHRRTPRNISSPVCRSGVECADDPGDSTRQQFTPAAHAPSLPPARTTGPRWPQYDAPARSVSRSGHRRRSSSREIASHFPARLTG